MKSLAISQRSLVRAPAWFLHNSLNFVHSSPRYSRSQNVLQQAQVSHPYTALSTRRAYFSFSTTERKESYRFRSIRCQAHLWTNHGRRRMYSSCYLGSLLQMMMGRWWWWCWRYHKNTWLFHNEETNNVCVYKPRHNPTCTFFPISWQLSFLDCTQD